MWCRTRRTGGLADGRTEVTLSEARGPKPFDGAVIWAAATFRPLRYAQDDNRSPVRRSARPSGFTLIEILVVIAVIAILASLVTPMVFRNVGDAKASATRSQIEIFGLALDSYRLDNDHYPSTAQGLEALRTAPSGDPPVRDWRGPYLKKGVPPDPYGRPYIYRCPGEVNRESYDLLSLGRDGQPGGTGEDADVNSWESKAR